MTRVEELLLGLDTLIGLQRDIGRISNMGLPISDLIALQKDRQASSVRRDLRRLAEKKSIRLSKRDDQLFVEILQSGKDLLEHLARRQVQPLPRGQRLLVLYDIPESHKLARQALRRTLSRLSFVQLQRSVWETDQNLHAPLTKAIDDLKIARWVKIYIVQQGT